MKTLLIVTYHPDEWREHAHVISWLRSIGYEVSITNIADVTYNTDALPFNILTDADIVVIYYTSTDNRNVSAIYKHIAERCIEMKRPIFGIHAQTQKPLEIEGKLMQWREWNAETMAFFMRVGEEHIRDITKFTCSKLLEETLIVK